MLCWRIARQPYADLSGSGGLKNSGRWHRSGHPVIYASTSIALASLEYAVHTVERPVDSVLLTIDVPNDSVMTIEEILGGLLPGNWPFAEVQTRHLGADWLESRASIALGVPPLVIPRERNLILNPLHGRFSEVRMIEVAPFFFDPRIFSTGRPGKRGS
jgi:RES domain-containing protein